jgi:hypothetical protein
MALAALVVGLVSIVGNCCCGFISLGLGVVAIALGAISLGKNRGGGGQRHQFRR